MKILVIRSEKGKVTETTVVEGDLREVVRSKAVEAVKEWDPESSDLVALRDSREIELPLPLKPEVIDTLNKYGDVRRAGNVAVASLPVYTISFDNMMVSEERYIENKIFLVSIYVNDEIKTLLEAEAAEITAERKEPEGIRELGD